MTLVAGVDSSTQSCKVVVRDLDTGAVVRTGRASHPDGTEVDPAAWWDALLAAFADAGGLDDVAAIAIAGQQHGMVCLDESGAVVRDALLWNDTRSAGAAADLVAELPGGAQSFAARTGSVPVAALTVSKLRWLAAHEPANAARTAAVCLPHDWLTWKLGGARGLEALRTDRGDASGTGYWSATDGYLDDVLDLAMGRRPALPTVLGPSDSPGTTPDGVLLGAGTGDNAAAALGLGAVAGDVIVSIGTSGVVSAVSERPSADASGLVSGFADATGRFLPLACTLNGARVLSSTAAALGVDLDRFAELALAAPPGCDGLVLVPYLEGERTPNKPDSTAALHGVTLANLTPAHLARAAVEGLLCGLADGLDALRAQGVQVRRLVLIGGGAKSPALRAIAPSVFGVPVSAPAASEYVADGAARQAAWVLAGSAEPPDWSIGGDERYDGDAHPGVRERYAEARELTLDRIGG
ncbi:xylulokinase [Jatrophihabitans endophyticus]|uniref:xylulokinase n=1 Tax=Jatrophihabitans endophyticus TaxID=1206085 RepID=UPI001A002E0A|nr:xylulokinase [Jatrophihabitans endophyticus]MBE7189577.1 xylulokinase [Jatrophihabitans endophyticus]